MSKPEILVADNSADPTSTIILPPQEEVSPLTHPDNLAAPAQLTPEEHDRAKEQFAEIAGRVASAQTVLAERSTDGKIRTRFDWNAYRNIDKTTIDQVVADAHAHKAEAQKEVASIESGHGTPEAKSPVVTFNTIADIERETDLEGMRVPDITTLHAAREAYDSIEAISDEDGETSYYYGGNQVSLPLLTRLKLDRNTRDETWILDESERERYILASQATNEEDLIAEDKTDFENFQDRTGLEGEEALAHFKDHRIARVNLSDVVTRRKADEAKDDSTPDIAILVPDSGEQAVRTDEDTPEKPNRRRVVAVLAAGALALGALFGIGHAVNEHNERAASEQSVEETVEKSQPATDGLGETSSLEELAAQQAEAEAQAQAEAAEAAAAAAAEAEANRHPLEAQEVRTVEIGGRGVWGAAEQFLAAHNLPVTNEYVNILMWDHLNWALEQARAQGQDVPATVAEFVNSGADRFMREYGATFPLDSVKKIEELSGVKAS